MKMRRLMVLFLVLIQMLFPGAVSAESGISLYAEDETAVMLGKRLSAMQQMNEAETEALDAVAGRPDVAALVTQQALIQGLEGYTDTDIRTDIQLLVPVCRDDLYLVCSQETAETFGIKDFPSLIQCLQEQPFELMLMRCFEASVTDYAAVRLFDTMDFNTETFTDASDCEENLDQGAFVLVADTEQAMRLLESGAVVIGALSEKRTAEFPQLPCAGEYGLPVCMGRVWALYCSTDMDPDGMRDLMSATELLTTEELAELHCSPLTAEEYVFADVLQEYIDYMTAEGLFFY